MDIFKNVFKNTVLFLIVFFTFLSIYKVQAQNDTIFYDAKWKVTSKQDASFFRPKIEKVGNLYRVEDYFINGNLQMSGISSSNLKDIWEGVVSWYDESGKLYQQGTYENNRLNGKYTSYDNGEELIGIYENGSFVSGKMVSDYGDGHFYQEKKGDSLLQVYYDQDFNGIRYENYSTSKKGNYLSKYYGQKGKLIGERVVLNNGYAKGVEVFYSYGPMKVQSINYSPYGRQLISSIFYNNGQVREKAFIKDKWEKEFYSKNGRLLGKLAYTLDRDYLRPFKGEEIRFHTRDNKGYSEGISSITSYDDSKIIKEQFFNTDGILIRFTEFNNGVTSLQVTYNDEGKEIYRMKYENGFPYDGIQTLSDRKTVYKDGELIEEILFYRNTKLPQKKKTKTNEVYYDLEGNVLGELELKYENRYGTPWEGEQFTLGAESGEIIGISEYKEGFLVKRTDFRKRLVTKDKYQTFKRVEEYAAKSYDKIREIRFYSNDIIQSYITFLNYREVKGVFYDKSGNEIGVYNYTEKNGKLYKFFNDTDLVQLFEDYDNGSIIASKRYEQQSKTNYYDLYSILIYELDINCCESYYSAKNGELIGTLIYKNKRPWEGIAYNNNDRTKYVINNGMREGDYVKYDYSDKIVEEGQYTANKKEGLFNYFNYNGTLKKSENYKDGKLDGEVIYYDDKGKLITKITYLNGKPQNGTKLLSRYSSKGSNQEIFKNGLLVKRITYRDNAKSVSTFVNGTEDETIVYYPESNLIRIKYRVKNNYIDGEVIRFDKEGKEEHRATLNKGGLVSGSILLTSNDYNNRVSHIQIVKNEEYVEVSIFDIDGVSIFEAKEKIILGSQIEYLNRLNFPVKYIDAYRLY
ncbi:toxin-antitoxin system YwqK family antitoxin [Maribacter sp. Asnod1-A12]|uniref:toxin-antitoxin system YwqK family antitoxin n=1 Tax=Maribacter sp. Asnod1-A12 TaxID=3160576 RepID=UPI00386CC805